MEGLIGKKIGMTRIFSETGASLPVTVVEVKPNLVTAIRDVSRNGYTALQLGYGQKKKNSKKKLRLNKALSGYFMKNKLTVPDKLREFRVEDISNYEIGQQIGLDIFKEQKYVDVQGRSIGKGFQGVVKRHGMHGGGASHGSKFKRRTGAIGQCSDPSRVFKGKKMPGQMGRKTCTVKNLEIVEIDTENNCLLIKGSIPGKKNNYLNIYKTRLKQSEK